MVSATDIITYIGVLLAVLGVSPVLYNFVVKWSLMKVTTGLRSDVKASTRLVNGVVELELPIYRISLIERGRHSDGIFPPAPVSKAIEGGSWVSLFFNQKIHDAAPRIRLRLRVYCLRGQALGEFRSLLL